MAKRIKLSEREVFALLVKMGSESVTEYFANITEQMRQDVMLQLQEQRNRIQRLEAMIGEPTITVESARTDS